MIAQADRSDPVIRKLKVCAAQDEIDPQTGNTAGKSGTKSHPPLFKTVMKTLPDHSVGI